jgi:cobalamin biosynthesis protein CobT
LIEGICVKKDILVIRESIGRVVAILTRQKVKVTQRGSRAYVAYHPRTGEVEQVNIPYLPDDASDEFVSAIQGFLDHEVGHVLHSDPKVLIDAKKAGKRVMNLANIIEDVYVERKMAEMFQGSGMNLESVRKFYLERIARPKIEEALAAGDLKTAQGYATVVAFRAWGGQASPADFIREPKMAELIKPIAEKLGPELIEQIAKCKNSTDCLQLAKQVKGKLEEPKPAEPPPPPPFELPPMTAEDGEPGDDSEPGEEVAVKGKPEEDDKGKSSKDKTEEEVPEAGDDETESSAEEETPEETPEESVEDDAPGDEPEADEPVESEDDTEGAGDDGGAEDDLDGEDDDAGEDDSDDDGSESGSSGDPAESGSELPSAPPDEPREEGGDPAPEPDPLAEVMDEKHDFDEDMSEELSKRGREEIEEADYRIFSTEWDRIEVAPLATGADTAQKMVERVRPMVGVMQKSLERAIAAQDKKMWNPGMRRGRVAPGSLFKVSVGDDRVFRQRFETRAKNTALSLLVDCSGSMSYGRIDVAGMAAFALASVLERIKVQYEVIGFTSKSSPAMMSAMRAEEGASSIRYGRAEALFMPVFKAFNERLTSEATSRIAHLTEGPGWLRENIDGESLQMAAHRLKQQRAERRVLIVLSDGQPSCPPAHGLREHLRKVAKTLPKEGVEVVGIGIQTDSVKSYYAKSVVINDVSELPTTVITQLTAILLS